MVKNFGSKTFTILKMGVFESTSSNSKAKKPKREELYWLRRAASSPKGENQSSFPTVITHEPDELHREAG